MNILMLSSNMINQGTYWRVFEFAKRLVNFGHEVTIVATSQRNRKSINFLNQEGINIALMPDFFQASLRSGWDPYNTLVRISFLKNQHYHIVHAFESRPTVIYPSIAAQNLGAKLVMDWCDWFGRGGSVEERPSPIIRSILRPIETFHEEHYRSRALATTVICSTLHDRAVQLGVPDNTITIIPNGLNISNWDYVDKNQARQLLKIDQDRFIVGYIGSIFFRDVKLMAQSCDRITKTIDNVRFFHLGYTNYPLINYVLDPKKVIQVGSLTQEQLNIYLAACDICWLPFNNSNANRGRFPYKISNYISSGKPIVATDVGDAADLITQENVGVISRDNPIDFAKNTIDLLFDINLRDSLQKRALLISKEYKYSWEQKTKQLMEIYTKIMDKG